MVIGMATEKITITVEDWLLPHIRAAARAQGESMSAWFGHAAQVELYREAGQQRAAADADRDTDRAALIDADGEAMADDLATERRQHAA